MKAIYIIYCALITLAAFSAQASAEVVGDANNDGILTTADSLIALRMSVGSVPHDVERVDVSGDGKVNSLDALMILSMAQKAQVRVNAPEVVSGAFNVTIDIDNTVDLDSGQFDLSFDSSVVNVTSIDSGSIAGTEVPIDMWRLMDEGRVRVLVNLPDATGVSGSGSLATIHFEVTGTAGDASVLDISDGLLVDTMADKVSATWTGDDVAIGVPVTINAPESVSGTFNVTIDVANVTNLDSGQFDLSFDSDVVNVTSVASGSVGTSEIRLDGWAFRDSDTVRVIFNLPGATGVSGSGSLATIHFEVTGTAGDTSVLRISGGLLVNIMADEVPAVWIDDEVSV